jgi:hypothetical protein
MDKLISIHQQKRTFTLDEAKDLLPLVHKMSQQSQRAIQPILNQIEAIRPFDPKQAQILELDIQKIVERWQSKVKSLGLTPKGCWLVDFDNGAGYFCWKYPENDVLYWHGYNDGFSGRKPVNPN